MSASEEAFRLAATMLCIPGSRNPLMRLFAVTASMLVFMLWQLKRLEGVWYRIRCFLKELIDKISAFLDCIVTITGKIIP